MREVGLAVSPRMALAAGTDDGRKMLAAATDRNEARGGARSGEKEAAGVTLGECAGTSLPPGAGDAKSVAGSRRDARVDGISLTVHP